MRKEKIKSMVHSFKGIYSYDKKTIEDWNSTAIGVYYIGVPSNNQGSLKPYYIGKSTSETGIRGRLLDHLRDNDCPDATYFGYCLCDIAKEADDFEVSEIKKYTPKYNTQHA